MNVMRPITYLIPRKRQETKKSRSWCHNPCAVLPVKNKSKGCR